MSVTNWIFASVGLLIIIEFLWAKRKGHALHNVSENMTTAVTFFLNVARAWIMINVISALPILPKIYSFREDYGILTDYTFANILGVYSVQHLPVFERWALLFVLADFAYFVGHYLSHKVNLLWVGHFTHHSIKNFNLLSGFRDRVKLLSPSGIMFGIPFIFGYRLGEILFMTFVISIYGILMHQKYFPKIPYYEWIFVTPSHHRMHHSLTNQDRQLNVNFGGVLIVWDRLFGTFLAEKENQHEFGVGGFTQNAHPFWCIFYEWKNIGVGLIKARNWRDVFSALLWDVRTKKTAESVHHRPSDFRSKSVG